MSIIVTIFRGIFLAQIRVRAAVPPQPARSDRRRPHPRIVNLCVAGLEPPIAVQFRGCFATILQFRGGVFFISIIFLGEEPEQDRQQDEQHVESVPAPLHLQLGGREDLGGEGNNVGDSEEQEDKSEEGDDDDDDQRR